MSMQTSKAAHVDDKGKLVFKYHTKDEKVQENGTTNFQDDSNSLTETSTRFDHSASVPELSTDKTACKHNIGDSPRGNDCSEKTDSHFKVNSLSKRKKLILASSMFAYFVAGLGYSVLAPIFPKEAERKGMSLTLVSFVFCEYEFMVLVTSPFFGSYLTSIGPKFALVSGTSVAGVCTVLFGLLNKCPPGTSFLFLSILSRGIGAIGIAANFIAVMSIVTCEFSKYAATCMALLLSAISGGFMVGPALGGVLSDIGGFGLPFFVIGLLTILSGVLVSKYMPSVEGTPVRSNVSILSLLRSSMVTIPMVAITIAGLGITFLDPTLALLIEPFGFSTSVVGLFFMIIPMLMVIVAPIHGYLTDVKEIYTYTIAIGLVVFGTGFLLIGPSKVFPFLSLNVWAVVVGLVIIGLSVEAIEVGSMKCMTVGSSGLGFKDDLDTFACLAGIYNVGYSLGGFLGPMAGGILVDFLGYSWAYTVVGLLCIVFGIGTFLFFLIRDFSKLRNYTTLQ